MMDYLDVLNKNKIKMNVCYKKKFNNNKFFQYF